MSVIGSFWGLPALVHEQKADSDQTICNGAEEELYLMARLSTCRLQKKDVPAPFPYAQNQNPIRTPGPISWGQVNSNRKFLTVLLKRTKVPEQ
jgi:hypothetical protein